MPDNTINENAVEWLRDAESDFAIASVKRTTKMRYTHLCFHAQQAAEKALKALFVVMSMPYPRTHDLAFIIDSLPPETTIPPFLLNLPILTKYSVQYRYPGQSLTITSKDLKQAIELTDLTISWVKTIVTSL